MINLCVHVHVDFMFSEIMLIGHVVEAYHSDREKYRSTGILC